VTISRQDIGDSGSVAGWWGRSSRGYPGGVPWQTRSIVKIREELILKALAGEETKVELAREVRREP
jgi:hypothetical protein